MMHDEVKPENETILCPECGSSKVWKDGKRYTKQGEIQRYFCRSCGFRFSESSLDSQVKLNVSGEFLEKSNSGKNLSESDIPPINFSLKPPLEDSSLKLSEDVGSHHSSKVTIPEKRLNNFCNSKLDHQVCVSLAEGAKNLAEVESREKRAAGATEKARQNIKSKLIEYAWHEKKRGLAESTVKQRIYRLKRLVKHGADLYNPDSVTTILAKSDWSPADKQMMVTTYKSFVKFAHLDWEPPRIQVPQKLPFIPREEEIDQLIAGCGRKTATFLQVLKETGARGIEAARLKWVDVDPESRTIRINHPVKGSLPRIVKVSAKTIAMINALPKNSKYIFNPNIHTIRQNFQKQRNRIARTLQNPRIRQIHLHTFRHWFATMQYYRTRDILYVKHLLGHKQIKNTEVYTHLINFERDDYHVAFAKTLEEEKELIEAGFEFVRYSEKDEVAIYRKRK